MGLFTEKQASSAVLVSLSPAIAVIPVTTEQVVAVVNVLLLTVLRGREK